MDPLINTSHQFPDGVVNPQFALLNYFFPGFSVLTSALHTYLGIDLNFYIPLLLAIFGLNFAWSYAVNSVWAVVSGYLMSSFRVRTDDEIYNMLMLWVSRQTFSQNSRFFFVNTDLYSRRSYLWGGNDDDEDDEDGGDHETSTDITGVSKSLHYTPSHGSHLFWYKGRPLMFERIQTQQQQQYLSASDREEISISCFGRSPQLLKELLLEARQMYLKKDERKTLIYRGSSNSSYGEPYWQRSMSRPNRPFSTVILNEKVKQNLIDDVADYLNPATRRWYANRGIPYRRGYLLCGPPGTGKSSLSLAIAGHFRMKIYIVSLSSSCATEEVLTSLFNNLPTQCLVLLEDIDSAGLTHTREAPDPSPPSSDATSPSSQPTTSGASNSTPSGRLSLSGLLNILDGVASKEGRLLIMTTNHIEKLDKALIRPGRVDMIIPFGLADSSMTEAIFCAIYAPFESELAARDDSRAISSSAADPDELDKERCVKRYAEITEQVAGLAKKFAANIPEHEFSPAEIQGLLLRHKHSPGDAIEAACEWVTETRKGKKEKEMKEAEQRRKEQEEEEKKKKEADAKQESGEQGGPDTTTIKKEDAETKTSSEDKETSKPEGQGDSRGDKKNGASDSEYEKV